MSTCQNSLNFAIRSLQLSKFKFFIQFTVWTILYIYYWCVCRNVCAQHTFDGVRSLLLPLHGSSDHTQVQGLRSKGCSQAILPAPRTKRSQLFWVYPAWPQSQSYVLITSRFPPVSISRELWADFLYYCRLAFMYIIYYKKNTFVLKERNSNTQDIFLTSYKNSIYGIWYL